MRITIKGETGEFDVKPLLTITDEGVGRKKVNVVLYTDFTLKSITVKRKKLRKLLKALK